MTGNPILDLVISITGVSLLMLLARLIFGAGGRGIDRAAAAERLAFDEPDFEPIDWLIGEGVALARNDAGELAVVMVHGDGLVTRRLGAASPAPYYRDGVLTVPRPDGTAREVHFTVPEDQAAAWLRASA
ncbi:MAG: hypothetical protein GXP06_07440 [Alphaproteobacteria bacterium]|nr:hypothetical protein [Alphaproteobacteria bacterium]